MAFASFERIFSRMMTSATQESRSWNACTSWEHIDVVRPQNFLWPLPWWAKMEAGRMLINRATLRAADYPGTCAFRRAALLACGHYDGDVLFDNEEIIRHFAEHGCRIAYANDLFVRKRPPSLRKWIEQRPRQAYEDFGMRFKTCAVLFIAAALFAGRDWVSAGGGGGFPRCDASLGAFGLAWHGRARGSAAAYFPRQCCLWAPLWIAERSLSTYWAFWWFVKVGWLSFRRADSVERCGSRLVDWRPAVSAQLRSSQKS